MKITLLLLAMVEFTNLVAAVATFIDAEDVNVSFDGSLLAYFCNGTTHDMVATNTIHSGSILHVCMLVPSGQFEVADVLERTANNAATNSSEPSQQIIFGSFPVSSQYAQKECSDADASDTNNICIVSFLLKADFYDYHALTLTGTGSVLLEFGDDTGGGRRKLALAGQFQIAATEFVVDDNSIGGLITESVLRRRVVSFVVLGVVAGVAVFLRQHIDAENNKIASQRLMETLRQI
jgi:hypothetical protein